MSSYRRSYYKWPAHVNKSEDNAPETVVPVCMKCSEIVYDLVCYGKSLGCNHNLPEHKCSKCKASAQCFPLPKAMNDRFNHLFNLACQCPENDEAGRRNVRHCQSEFKIDLRKAACDDPQKPANSLAKDKVKARAARSKARARASNPGTYEQILDNIARRIENIEGYVKTMSIDLAPYRYGPIDEDAIVVINRAGANLDDFRLSFQEIAKQMAALRESFELLEDKADDNGATGLTEQVEAGFDEEKHDLEDGKDGDKLDLEDGKDDDEKSDEKSDCSMTSIDG